MADGKKLVGHAGAVLLRRCADRTGPTDAPTGVLPSSTAAGRRERAGVPVHLAIAITRGAANFPEAEQLPSHHRPLFGPAASDSTARRTPATFTTCWQRLTALHDRQYPSVPPCAGSRGVPPAVADTTALRRLTPRATSV